MRARTVAPTLFAAVLAGCVVQGDPPAPTRTTALEILDVPVGSTHPQFARIAAEGAFAGSVVVAAPLVSGPLTSTFSDYSVQVAADSKRVIAVQADRTFASMSECQDHFTQVATSVRSKFEIESEAATGPAWLEMTSGPLGIEVSCTLDAGSIHPTLHLSIAHTILAEQVFRGATGR